MLDIVPTRHVLLNPQMVELLLHLRWKNSTVSAGPARHTRFSACGAQALIACQIPPDSGVFDTQ